MKYYIAENSQQAGPFEPYELLQHGLTANSLVWCEGMSNWTSASQVPELMALLSGQPFNPIRVDTQVKASGTSISDKPYAQPQYYPNDALNPQQMPTKTWFTESVIVTILAALCCCNPIGLLTGIYAIAKANSAKKKVMAGDYIGLVRDADTAKIWVIVTAVIIVIWILFITITLLLDPGLPLQIQEGAVG